MTYGANHINIYMIGSNLLQLDVNRNYERNRQKIVIDWRTCDQSGSIATLYKTRPWSISGVQDTTAHLTETV